MITRRHFVSAGLGLLAGSGFLYYLGSSTSLKNAALTGVFAISPDCLHPGLGEAYLQGVEPKPTAESLRYALELRLKSPLRCDEQLKEQLQQEFAQGKTLEVNSWVLPESIVLINAYSVLANVH